MDLSLCGESSFTNQVHQFVLSEILQTDNGNVTSEEQIGMNMN